MKTVYKKILFVSFLLIWFIFPQNISYSQNSEKFPLGAYINQHWYENYSQIKDMGVNTIVQYAADGSDTTENLTQLQQFDKVIAFNYLQTDPIHHYSGGYYKKWEAEEDIVGNMKSGIKHSFGKDTTIGGDLCWSSGNQTAQKNNFIYGPHYAQDKKYRQGYMSDYFYLNYIVKFLLRLETQPDQPVDVCSLKIRYKYEIRINGIYSGIGETILDSKVVNTSNLSTSEFKEITMTYSYPQRFIPKENTEIKFMNVTAADTTYDDRLESTGIEFVVDYLGGARIAVDFIEVYDQQIWGVYLAAPSTIAGDIIDYATNAGFAPISQKLRYWHSQDAPLTLDGYEPYRVIDSILNATPNAKTLITVYYPMWNGEINGRNSFERWNTLAQSKQLMFWYFPTN